MANERVQISFLQGWASWQVIQSQVVTSSGVAGNQGVMLCCWLGSNTLQSSWETRSSSLPPRDTRKVSGVGIIFLHVPEVSRLLFQGSNQLSDILPTYYCSRVISSSWDVTTSHYEAETSGKTYRRSWPHSHGKKDPEHPAIMRWTITVMRLCKPPRRGEGYGQTLT